MDATKDLRDSGRILRAKIDTVMARTFAVMLETEEPNRPMGLGYEIGELEHAWQVLKTKIIENTGVKA